MIVCDKCREEKKLTKYVIPKEDWTGWNVECQDSILYQYTERKVLPTEIELCDECATEVAKKIWN